MRDIIQARAVRSRGVYQLRRLVVSPMRTKFFNRRLQGTETVPCRNYEHCLVSNDRIYAFYCVIPFNCMTMTTLIQRQRQLGQVIHGVKSRPREHTVTDIRAQVRKIYQVRTGVRQIPGTGVPGRPEMKLIMYNNDYEPRANDGRGRGTQHGKKRMNPDSPTRTGKKHRGRHTKIPTQPAQHPPAPRRHGTPPYPTDNSIYLRYATFHATKPP